MQINADAFNVTPSIAKKFFYLIFEIGITGIKRFLLSNQKINIFLNFY